jgi:hypothetical protein
LDWAQKHEYAYVKWRKETFPEEYEEEEEVEEEAVVAEDDE